MEFLYALSPPNELYLHAGLEGVNHLGKITPADLRAVIYYSPSVKLLWMTS